MRERDQTAAVMDPMEGHPSEVVIDYTNWRGERAKRRIAPASIFWGETDFHPGPKQWLLLALDLDRDVERVFAMKDIHGWEPARPARK